MRQEDRAGRQRGRVIHGNQPANGNAGERIEEGKHSLEYRATDILEIDVDTFRAGCCKTAVEIRCPMIDAGIEAEFLGHVTTFVWSSCDADGVGALDAGHKRAHRSCARACRGRAKARECATASGRVRAVGSEVFPNENYLTSAPQPAVRQEQSVG